MQSLAVVSFDLINEIICHLCGKRDEKHVMFLCDWCGYGQH